MCINEKLAKISVEMDRETLEELEKDLVKLDLELTQSIERLNSLERKTKAIRKEKNPFQKLRLLSELVIELEKERKFREEFKKKHLKAQKTLEFLSG